MCESIDFHKTKGSRYWVRRDDIGRYAVYDTEYKLWHYPSSQEPMDNTFLDAKALREKLESNR